MGSAWLAWRQTNRAGHLSTPAWRWKWKGYAVLHTNTQWTHLCSTQVFNQGLKLDYTQAREPPADVRGPAEADVGLRIFCCVGSYSWLHLLSEDMDKIVFTVYFSSSRLHVTNVKQRIKINIVCSKIPMKNICNDVVSAMCTYNECCVLLYFVCLFVCFCRWI